MLDEDSDDRNDHADDDAELLGALTTRIGLELLAYASFRATLQDKELLKSDKHKSGPRLGWWQSKAATWPILSRAVRSILCIPESSAKS